ncbi:unnamed protein product, partial [Schistosoma turkestanicum]
LSPTAENLPTITIHQNSLREINDPMLDMITVMHKLAYLTQEFAYNNNISKKYETIQCIVK